MTVHYSHVRTPKADHGFGYFPQAETHFEPCRVNRQGFYVQDERYAAGAGSPGVPEQARIGLLGAIVQVLQIFAQWSFRRQPVPRLQVLSQFSFGRTGLRLVVIAPVNNGRERHEY